MPLRDATVMDYVTGRLDADTARVVETTARRDSDVAAAVGRARALNTRMLGRLTVRDATLRNQHH